MQSDLTSKREADLRPKKAIYNHLYVQVLTAIFLGVVVGHFFPNIGEAMKPLGDIFIKAVKMIIAPLIFLHNGARDRERWRPQESPDA